MPLVAYPPLQLRNLRRSLEAHVPIKALRDVVNRVRFGPEAPLSDECLWIDPRKITHSYRPDPKSGTAPLFRRHASGKVVGGDWDRSVIALGQNPKYKACIARYRDGVPWEETGLYEEMLARIKRHGSFDGLRSFEDIERRYATLDKVAQDARRTGRLKARRELDGSYFRREHGGVMAHIARDGTLLRGGGGQHRFALAKALDLPLIPVQLGVIHRNAFEAGILGDLRKRPPDYCASASQARLAPRERP